MNTINIDTIPGQPVILTPANDPTPVEKAVAQSIIDDFDPETFLMFVFYQPDGGCRLWYGWTVGGHQLGDDVDRRALAAGMDCADWLEISERHVQTSLRGRIQITAHPLRPALADVQTGVRGGADQRANLWKIVNGYYGQPDSPADLNLPWLGFGPAIRAK